LRPVYSLSFSSSTEPQNVDELISELQRREELNELDLWVIEELKVFRPE